MSRCHEICVLPNGWGHHCAQAPCLASFNCKYILAAHVASSHKKIASNNNNSSNFNASRAANASQTREKKRLLLHAQRGSGVASGRRDLSAHRIVVISLGSHEIRVGLASATEPTSRVRAVVAWRKAEKFSEFSDSVNEFTTDVPQRDERESAAHARTLAASLDEWRVDSTLFPHEFIHTALTDALSDDGPIVLPDDSLAATRATAPLPRCIVGDDALRLAPDAPFTLVYPIEQGYVAQRDKSTPTSVALASIEALLRHSLLAIGIDDSSIGSYAACLIVPTMHRRRDTVALVDLLLERLAFAECFVNTDAMCAALGSVHDTACVVDIGHQRTAVACVVEGVVQPESRCHMPFGAQGVAAALMHFLRIDDEEAGRTMFGPRELSIGRARDLALVERLRNALCHVDVRAPLAAVHRPIRLRTLDFDLSQPSVRELLLDCAKSDSFSSAALTLFSPGALNCASPTPAAVAQFADDVVADDVYSQAWLRAVDNVELLEPRPTRVKAKGYVPRAAGATATSEPKLQSCQIGDTGLISAIVESAANVQPIGGDPAILDKVMQLNVGATVALRPEEMAAFYVAGGRVMEASLDLMPPLENGKLVWTPQFHAVFIAAVEIAHLVGEGTGPSAILKYMIAIGAPPINKPQVSSHLQKWRKDMLLARGRSRRSDALEHELQLASITAVGAKGKVRKSTDGPGVVGTGGDDDGGPPPLQPIGGGGGGGGGGGDDEGDENADDEDVAALKKRKRDDDADDNDQAATTTTAASTTQQQPMQTDDAPEQPAASVPIVPLDPKAYAHSMLPLQVARPELGAAVLTSVAMPIDEAVLQSVLSLDWASISLRAQLMNNIVVVGGGALIGGIQQLLEARLICHPEVPSESVATVNYSQQGTPQVLSWRGAALMAWQASARRLYVTKGEWQMYGSAVLRERVPFKW
jgi:actin-related protein